MTRQRFRLPGGTELAFVTAGDPSMPAAAAVSLMLDFIKRTQLARGPRANLVTAVERG